MKKHISIVTLDYRAGQFYESQIKELFGELVITRVYSVLDGSVRKVDKADLFVVSTDAFESNTDLRKYIPLNIPIVEITMTYTNKVINTLMNIPNGSKALFVNLSEKMVREAIARLSQIGINHIAFTPYYPGALPVSGFELAVTPDEARYVPKDVKTIIDIGQRVIDSTTVVEIALRLKFDYLLEREKFKEYFRSIAANNYSFDQLFGRSLRLESHFEILMNILDEGIIGINEDDMIFACNSKAADICGISIKEAIDHPVESVFAFLPFKECKDTQKRMNNRLVKSNGVDINVTIAPVIRENKYMGAFATIQRFSEEESKQHKLRIQMLDKGHKAKYTFDDIIGESDAIKKACAIAKKMAKTDGAVLITGETGTGKELFAQAMHNESKRCNYPFIAINCAAIADNLLESELFGYEEGSFTGAKRGGKLGLFEFAHSGTIFLDEVEGMSQALQIKLLRVIQEKEVMRVGGNKIINIDVRIIAATNERIDELVANGNFRKDLYYRLNTLPIQLPPLRERGEDIILISEYFKQRLGGHFEFSSQVIDAFMSYHWDGNIRELHNYIEYFTYLEKDIINYEDLLPNFHNNITSNVKPEYESDAKKDAELLVRLADNKLDDYIFVLQKLYDGFLNKDSVGRISIAKEAEVAGRYLTQGEIRTILNNLDNLGLIRVSKGRGGSKINERGIKALHHL